MWTNKAYNTAKEAEKNTTTRFSASHRKSHYIHVLQQGSTPSPL